MNAHQPIDARDVMLPTAPHYSVAMAHQKPISAIVQHTGSDRPWDAIEHRERQPVAAVYYVEQQAAVAALLVLGGQDPQICRKSDAAIAIARRKIEVGDAAIAGMARVDGKVRRTVELQIWASDTKSSPTREALPSVDFKRNDGHRGLSVRR